MTVNEAVCVLNASPAGIPGLWNAPGYPELTTAQMLQAAQRRQGPNADYRDVAFHLLEIGFIK